MRCQMLYRSQSILVWALMEPIPVNWVLTDSYLWYCDTITLKPLGMFKKHTPQKVGQTRLKSNTPQVGRRGTWYTKQQAWPVPTVQLLTLWRKTQRTKLRLCICLYPERRSKISSIKCVSFFKNFFKIVLLALEGEKTQPTMDQIVGSQSLEITPLQTTGLFNEYNELASEIFIQPRM